MSEGNKHALLSPSSAEKWLNCSGALVMEKGLPNQTSKYAENGTAAHELAKLTLLDAPSHQTFAFLGQQSEDAPDHSFDSEMCEQVQNYVDFVLQYAEGKKLLVEQKLSLTKITGEEDADGTSDAVIIAEDEIIVIDLKYGYEEVSAEKNSQLMIYGMSALEEYSYLTDFKRIRLVIYQPRINNISEWDITTEELVKYQGLVSVQAKKAIEVYNNLDKDSPELEDILYATEKGCRWCKARSFCPKRLGFVEEAIGVKFEDLTKEVVIAVKTKTNETIGSLLPKLGMIEDWVKSVRDKAESELHLGNAIPGYKLVEGRKGHRKWTSKDEAETLLKAMRLKQEEMYSFEVISPTQAEKLLAENHPKKWTKLEAVITQGQGSPTVVPEKDKRPALLMAPVEFSAVEDNNDLL